MATEDMAMAGQGAIESGAGEVQAHQWHRNTILSALLMLCTVVSMVLSSGAGTNWF